MLPNHDPDPWGVTAGRVAGRRAPFHWLAIAVVVGLAAWHTHALFWTCDDAFISFRYADHLVAGKGLVYNEVERVEGYSNFLWTVLIAAARAVTGFDAAVLGNWLGAMFYLGTLLLLIRAALRAGAHAVPVAAVGLSAHYHSKVFASCGLETGMVTFFITAMVLALMVARSTRGYLLAGLLGTAVALTRADGPLPYGLAGLFVLVEAWRRRRWAWFLAMLLPGLLLWVPYFLLRWSYYGDFFANVFYAKSVSHPYPGQGFVYAGMFFGCYWVLIPALLGAVWLCCRAGPQRRAAAVITAVAVPFVLFVVWIGGDFMFARYLVPITPLLYLVFDLFARSMSGPWRPALLAAGVGLGSLLMIYPGEAIAPRPGGVARYGIVEERQVYTPLTIEDARQKGDAYARLLAGTRSRVAIAGGQAALAYYGRFWLVIECATGLTDRTIARQELQGRGMVGHEKRPPDDYLLSRHVHFVLFPPDVMGYRHRLDAEIRTMHVGPERITLLTWDRELMRTVWERVRELRYPDGTAVVRFVDIEAYLDRYLETVGTRPVEQVAADLHYFERFYFDHNDDPQRLARFRAALRR